MKKYKFGVLGLGKMGSSILNGIINSKIFNIEDVLLFDVNDQIISMYSMKGFKFTKSESELIENVEMLLISIKPQMFKIFNDINLKLEDNQLIIISVVAGKTIFDLEQIFGKQNYIRVMPNTPALINAGATAIARKDVPDEIFEVVKKIFLSVGVVEEITEDKMNEIIPVNGSMPAFLYYFMETYIDDAVSKGIDYDVATKLCAEAIIGSAKMVLESGKPISELIKDVCSPGGATLAGLKVFDDCDFKKIIIDSNEACINRAYELSKLKWGVLWDMNYFVFYQMSN